MTFQNPDDAALRALLERSRRIAIVGASPRPERPSHGVMAYLQGCGYRCIPVRPPGGEEILGERSVASLRDLDAPPDIVDVFRAPEHVPAVVEEAIAAGAPAIWLQEGVVHPEAAERARAAGLTVVMDLCILRVHRRLCGGASPA
ncbi:MAG: CoA-binding protein [Planctomycetota bacterium]|nr:MAG: CoA-binding protein [Planctomycetota bacterium]